MVTSLVTAMKLLYIASEMGDRSRVHRPGCNQALRPTQPPSLSGTENEHWPTAWQCSLLRAGVQPTLDPSAETLCRSNALFGSALRLRR